MSKSRRRRHERRNKYDYKKVYGANRGDAAMKAEHLVMNGTGWRRNGFGTDRTTGQVYARLRRIPVIPESPTPSDE